MAIRNIAKFCCTLLVLIVLCGDRSNAMQRFCGKALPEALDNICLRGFNSKIKKSMDFNLESGLNGLNALNGLADYSNYNEIEDEQLPYPYANSPFLNKIHGGSANLMAKTRRRRHGVYDECCRKGCTITELMSYCL